MSGAKMLSAWESLQALAKEYNQTPSTADEIAAVCNDIKALLLAKNEAYGDSALDPVRVFAPEASADLQLRVRLDDKLSRIARGKEAGEDVINDLIGYLVLLKVSRMRGEK